MKTHDKTAKVKRDLGEAVRKKRTELGMTAEELASKCNITTSAVTAIERGERYPSITVLLDLCHFLQVGVNTLTKGAARVS